MLVTIVLERLCEANGREACFVEYEMIATAAEPVDIENQVNCLLAVDFLDRASQFTRRRVVIILIAAARKKAHAMRCADRRVAANDVVVEHAAHRVSLLLHPFEHPGTAKQSLLLA